MMGTNYSLQTAQPWWDIVEKIRFCTCSMHSLHSAKWGGIINQSINQPINQLKSINLAYLTRHKHFTGLLYPWGETLFEIKSISLINKLFSYCGRWVYWYTKSHDLKCYIFVLVICSHWTMRGLLANHIQSKINHDLHREPFRQYMYSDFLLQKISNFSDITNSDFCITIALLAWGCTGEKCPT